MKKTFSLFFVLLFVSFFCVNCGEADRRPVKVSDDADSGAVDADHEDQTDTDSDPEENDTEEPEVTDDVEPEPDENPDIPDDEPDEPADEDDTVFTFGPYVVNMIISVKWYMVSRMTMVSCRPVSMGRYTATIVAVWSKGGK